MNGARERRTVHTAHSFQLISGMEVNSFAAPSKKDGWPTITWPRVSGSAPRASSHWENGKPGNFSSSSVAWYGL